MPFIPPPYEEVSPDGRRYFKLLGVSPHLIRMYELLLQASELASLRPGGRTQAAQIDLLILQVKREVEQSARITAIETDAIIRDKIEATRVRPPGLLIGNRNTTMASGIRSRPVVSILPGGGAVGIADIEELIQATYAPSSNSQVDYFWRAQEFGSEHLLGKVLYGVFMPGDAAPLGPGPNRTHPAFQVRGRGGGKRYKMVVRNPIEERGFLREGAYEGSVLRKRLNLKTEARAVSEMRRIAASPMGLGLRR